MHVKEAILMHMERESSIMKSVTREWLDSMTLVWYMYHSNLVNRDFYNWKLSNELMKNYYTNYPVVKQFK